MIYLYLFGTCFHFIYVFMIIGKNHKGAILTINDRATSRVWIRKLSGKEAIPVAKIAS